MRKPKKQSKPFASITIHKLPNTPTSKFTRFYVYNSFTTSIYPNLCELYITIIHLHPQNINSPKKSPYFPHIIINSSHHHHNRSYTSSANLNSSISDMGPIVLTQIATGLSVLAGAALLKSVMDQNPMMGPGSGEPRCSRCNGTGRVTCLCNRWSDGDRGCRTCAGSGRMMCSSCGGSGTGRPLPVRISVRPPNQPY